MLIITSTGYQLNGITTLVWGTGGSLRSPKPTAGFAGEGYYTVRSIDQADKVDPIYGENCTGVEAWRVLILHGKRWNLTVQDDTTMSAPTTGSNIVIVDFIDGAATSLNAMVISNDYRAAQRQPGERVLQVENLVLVDSQVNQG